MQCAFFRLSFESNANQMPINIHRPSIPPCTSSPGLGRCESHAETLIHVVDLVQKIYHHFILLYTKAIEVFSNGMGQLLFALSASAFATRHRRRQLANTARKNELVVWIAKSRRRVETVRVPVYVQGRRFYLGPFHIVLGSSSSDCNIACGVILCICNILKRASCVSPICYASILSIRQVCGIRLLLISGA